MSDESTPVVETLNVDTSTQEPVEVNTPADTSTDGIEPTEVVKTADTEEKNDNDKQVETVEEKLYAGKYKTPEDLEKAYKEAEKAVTQKAEYEKQLQIYKEQEEKVKLEREMQARQMGFGTVDEQNIAKDTAVNEFNLFAQALNTGKAGGDFDVAFAALQSYQSTGNPEYLKEAKGYFSPETLEFIAVKNEAFKNGKLDELKHKQTQQNYLSIKENLENFAKENNDWLEPKSRQDVIGLVIKAFGSSANLKETKDLIDNIENTAIERFKLSEKAKQEQETRHNQMQSPGASGVVKATEKGGDWRDVDSPEEMEKLINKYI